MWEPMAVAIMMGLLFATVITLLFVPVLYKILFRIPCVARRDGAAHGTAGAP